MEINKREFSSGRIGGVLFQRPQTTNGPTLVVFNQWRSGAKSLFSQRLADLVFEHGGYSSILFLDRIRSGGMSANLLSKDEKKQMQIEADFQFGTEYAAAIEATLRANGLPEMFVIAGSSAGASGALAAADQASDQCLAVVLVEPGGLRAWGIGRSKRLAFPHALSQHIFAYRHRLQRGWWTPMDREQYFAKGPMFESRAKYLATDRFFHTLSDYVQDDSKPTAYIVLSQTSHAHRPEERNQLNVSVTLPHQIKEIHGNHDQICQPQSLAGLYNTPLEEVVDKA